jgi:glycopeptide antibiotics resistance protein
MIEKPKKKNVLTLILFGTYFIILTWLVLFKLQFSVPVLPDGRVLNFWPFLDASFPEIRNNILVFIPLGLYVCMIKSPWSFVKGVLTAAGISALFEILQFVFAIGRADVTDLISNTIGGIVGIGVYALLAKFLKSRANKALNIIAAIITAALLLFVAVLLINHRWIRIR